MKNICIPLLIATFIPSLLLGNESVTNYKNDFDLGNQNAGIWDSGWRYFWNAPQGWQPGNTGNLNTGSINDIASHKLLQPSGISVTADGDGAANNDPSFYLRLSASGGHPGSPVNSNNGESRYAIAAYKVAESGMYSIANSSLNRPSPNGDDIELLIYTDLSKSTSSHLVAPGETISFNKGLGYLASGDVIYIAIGSGLTGGYDGFNIDLDIERTDAQVVLANYRSDYKNSAPLTTGWSYLWNQPKDWTSSGVAGALKSSSIGAPDSYLSLVDAGSRWTPDGDTTGNNNLPGGYLTLASYGGHPGVTGNAGAKDRYAIAAYTVPNSGYYAIEESWIETGANGDGVEVLVFPGTSGAVKQVYTEPSGGQVSFDVGIGYLEAGQIIYVAVGGGGTSSYDGFNFDFSVVHYPLESLQSQFSNAAESGTVEFIPGDYYHKTEDSVLSINGKNDLEVIAHGVKVICQNRRRAVDVYNSENVGIKGLTIDYDPKLYGQGTIEAISPTSIDVRLHDGYEQDFNRINSWDSLVVYNPAPDSSGDYLMRSGCSTRYPTGSNQEIEPGLVRLSTNRVDQAAVSDYCSFRLPTGIPHAISIDESKWIDLKDVTLHGSPSFGIIASKGSESTFDHVRITPCEQPVLALVPPLLSSNADGIHLKNTEGDFSITNCTLTYTGDDSIALSSAAMVVLEKQGANITVFNKNGFFSSTNDPLEIYDMTGSPSTQAATIGSVSNAYMPLNQAQNAYEAHFPAASYTIKSGDIKNITLLNGVTCEVGDIIVNTKYKNDDFVIENCYIKNSRARGVIVKSSGSPQNPARIANNEIVNTWLAGIQLVPDLGFWQEVDFSSDVQIAGNTLRSCGISPNSYGALRIGLSSDRAWTSALGHSDIEISGNSFYGSTGVNMYISYATVVTISDNSFNDSHHNTWDDKTYNKSLVWLKDIDNVVFSGNNTHSNLNTTNANLNALIQTGGQNIGNWNPGNGITPQ